MNKIKNKLEKRYNNHKFHSAVFVLSQGGYFLLARDQFAFKSIFLYLNNLSCVFIGNTFLVKFITS